MVFQFKCRSCSEQGTIFLPNRGDHTCQEHAPIDERQVPAYAGYEPTSLIEWYKRGILLANAPEPSRQDLRMRLADACDRVVALEKQLVFEAGRANAFERIVTQDQLLEVDLTHALELSEARVEELEGDAKRQLMCDAPPNQKPILGSHVAFGHFTIRQIDSSSRFVDLRGNEYDASAFVGWWPSRSCS